MLGQRNAWNAQNAQERAVRVVKAAVKISEKMTGPTNNRKADYGQKVTYQANNIQRDILGRLNKKHKP